MSTPDQGQLPESPQPGTRRWRLALLLLPAAGFALYLLLPWLTTADSVRRWAERTATATSGFDVVIGELRLGHDLSLELFDVSVAELDVDPFLTVDRAVVRLSPTGVFSDQPVAVALSAPRLDVDRLPAAQPAEFPSRVALPFRTLEIEGGYIVTDTSADPVGPITVTVDALRAATQDVQLWLRVDRGLPPINATASIGTRDGKLEFPTKLTWHGVPLGSFAERFGFGAGDAFDGFLDASAEVSGPLDDLSGRGSLQVRELRYRADGGEVSAVVDASVEVSGTLDEPNGRGTLQARDLRYRAGGVEVSGSVDAPFTLAAKRIVLEDPGVRFGNVAWTAGGLTGSTPAATFAGAIAFDEGGVRTVGRFAVEPIQARDETSERVVEGLAVTGKLDGLWDATSHPVLELSVSASAGEVLWDRFYADVARYPATAAAKIAFADRQRVVLSDIDARVANVVSVVGSAHLTPTASPNKADLRIEVADLDGLYALAVRDPFQESHPFLAQMEVGGNLNAHIVYERSASAFTLTGQLRMRDGSLSASDPDAAVRGVRLDLPLRLGDIDSGASETGELRIGTLRGGDIRVEEVSAPLAVRDNSIGLAAPLTVPLLGGALEIGEFVVSELLAPRPRASVSVAVVDLDLAALAAAAELPPLRGTISGAIPKITAVGSQVRSEGEIGIKVFDGKVSVRDLSIDRAFSPLPAFGLNLDFEDISLGRVTETLEIGRISGVARGAAENLVIVNNQPLSFDAWMETVERSGVSQRISVSAIQQLSILGGSGGDPLTQGILGFFDEYRYAKMGFKCRLENDRFELYGVETIDGKEYLVVGSRLPPSVNVVSHTQVISFPDMVRRLQRVTNAAAREDEKGEEQ
jgi:hypothetical protein